MKKMTLTIIVFFFLAGIAQAAPLSVGFITRINKNVKTFKEIREENIVPQTSDYSCGPASLATLLSYYFEDEVTEREIINFLLRTTNLKKVRAMKGFSLLDLKNFAKQRGYKVTGYKMDLEFLVNLDSPVLVPVNIKDYSHFIVFRGIKGGRVFIADPALGNLTIKVERFLKIWQGNIGLVLEMAGYQPVEPPLELSDEEIAAFADPGVVRKILGITSIGQINRSSEF